MLQISHSTSLPGAQIATIQLAPSATSRSLNSLNSIEQSSSVKTYPEGQSTYSGVIDQLVENWNRDLYEPSITSLGKAFDWIMGWSLDENGNKAPSVLGRVANLFTKTFNTDSLSKSPNPYSIDERIKEKVGLRLAEENHYAGTPNTGYSTYDSDPNSSSCAEGHMEMTHYGVYCTSDYGIVINWKYDVNVTSFPSSSQKEDYCRCIFNNVINYYFLDVSTSHPFCEINTSYAQMQSSMPQGMFYAWRASGLYNNQHYKSPSNKFAESCFSANYNRTAQLQNQPVTIYVSNSLSSAYGNYYVAYRDDFCSLSYTRQNWTLELSPDFSENIKSYPDIVNEYSKCLVDNVILPYFQYQDIVDCYPLRNAFTLNYQIPNGTLFKIFASEGVTFSEYFLSSLNENSLNTCYNQYSSKIDAAKENAREYILYDFMEVVLFGGVVAFICAESMIFFKHKYDLNKRNEIKNEVDLKKESLEASVIKSLELGESV